MWHRLGTIRASDVDGLVGFASGYVALEGSAGIVWHSPDGRSWRRTRLPIELPLDEALDANGLLGRVLTTNGREVLVVGGYSHAPCQPTPAGDTGGGPECAVSPIAWLTDDGRSWRRLRSDQVDGGEFVAAWPASSGGWNAAVSSWDGVALGGNDLWYTEDGTAWTRAAAPPAAWEGYDVPVGVADGSGQYVLAASERGRPGTTLAALTEGGSWRVVDGFQGADVLVVAGVAKAGDRTRWVLGGRDRCGDVDVGCAGGPTIWSAVGGADWTTARLPMGSGVPGADPPVVVSTVESLALSDRGYVAVGADVSWSEGARHETWVSDDGVSWTLLPQADRPRFDYGPGIVANGPSGVIGISASEAEDEQVVWQLR